MRAQRWFVGLLAVLTVACSGSDESSKTRGTSTIDPADFSVEWTYSDGTELPDGVGESNPELVINTHPGPEHCGWESAVIMHLAWPIGTITRTVPPARQYGRDPAGVLPDDDARANFDRSVALPAGARDTGMRNGPIELWVASSTADDEVYVGKDGAFEAWPRLREPVACA